MINVRSSRPLTKGFANVRSQRRGSVASCGKVRRSAPESLVFNIPTEGVELARDVVDLLI